MQENFNMEELMDLLLTRQFRKLKDILTEMNEVDIATFIEELDSEKTVVVFRMLPKELASDVFACLEVDKQEQLSTASRTMNWGPLWMICSWTMRLICWRSFRPMW